MKAKVPELFVFVHIPKTAGSTFVKHLVKNFPSDELLEVSPAMLGLSETSSRTEYRSALRRLFGKMNSAERNKLKVIYGHCLPAGIHKLVHRDAYYFTFLRDPVSRALSIYNYLRTLYDLGVDGSGDKDRIESLLFVNGVAPEFRDWLENKYFARTRDYGLKSQADYLRKFGYLKGGDYGGAMRHFDFVGSVERYGDDSLYMYRKIGIAKLFVSQNESKKYYSPTRGARLLLKIKFVDDYRLYRVGRRFNLLFRRNNKSYAVAVKVMRKHRWRIVYNQLRYDFAQTMRMLKWKLF